MAANMHNITGILMMLFLGISCTSGKKEPNLNFKLPPEFGDYWYQGQAELAKYKLQQVRYGETREGHAVLIFVSEDFSRSKQVKLDNQGVAGDDVLKVMKMNAMRKFTTGIYPYSTMTSVFTPIYLDEDPQSVKMTSSVQEWCGQTFMQANLKASSYQVQSNSYFESDGDEKNVVDNVLLEDEIWNRIRLNPEALPIGILEVLPGALYCRFVHKEFKPAIAEVQLLESDGKSQIYQLEYPGLDRTVKIEFENNFPYKIISWEESYPEGNKMKTTRAELDTAIQLDYWSKNRNVDSHFRRELGLE